MDILFICKDASASSLAANLLWAMQARDTGSSVAVLFSSEALAAFQNGTFLWPRELSHQDSRLAIADSAKAKGLPIMLRGEARQLDFHGVFARAKEVGVPMYADPIWTDLLGLRGKVPAGVAELDAAAGVNLLRDAKTVVGSLQALPHSLHYWEAIMGWTAWEEVTGSGLDFTDITYKKKYHEELGGGVARIAVNRQKQYNAFTAHTLDEAFHAVYDASHDPLIGVLLLTGEGDHFGTGGDVEWEQWGLREQFYWRYAPNRLMRISRKPIVAVIRGYCIGGSHHLAYCSDFSIAADNAIFGQNGPRVSSPADGYIMPYLTRVVGAKKARELWMLCRRYSASEALEMGLVNRVVTLEKLDAEVDRWCEDLLKASPGCLEVLKASFDWEIDTMPQMGLMAQNLYPDWFDSAEGKEGVTAFLEKRKPDFWKIRRAEIEAQKKP